jgi:hypothetical protein
MFVTPSIQNLIREGKTFRIDSDIQTGKKYGMQLLDDNLWGHFTAGRISAEEAIDKSRNPGAMVDKLQRAGIAVNNADQFEIDDSEEGGAPPSGGPPKPPQPPTPPGAPQMSDAERQAQIAANRARMQAMKK